LNTTIQIANNTSCKYLKITGTLFLMPNMKKLLLLLSLIIPMAINAQDWLKNLPQDKSTGNNLTFFEIQQAFEKYNYDNHIINGKREINGKTEKIPGWKQFRRWEWYWDTRVNPVTGEFPKTRAVDQYAKYLTDSKPTKSNAGNWISAGPSASDGGYAGVGRVNCIAFHPTNNNIFWVGTPSGGLWKTTDGGTTWTVLTDQNTVLGVSDIAIPSDYATSHTIYIATGDRDGGSLWSLGGGMYNDNNSIGILKSTDDGVTWQSTGLTYTASQNKSIGRLLVHPSNPSLLVVSTSSGIMKSVNGGTTWSSVFTGSQIIDMEFKPGTPATIYASTQNYSGSPQILKSTNTGDTWTAIKTFTSYEERIELAVTANDANYIYAIVSNTSGGLKGIYKSTNGGVSFTEMVNGDNTNKSYLYYYSDGSGSNTGQGGYDLCIAASPLDKNLVLIGGINTWKSTDGGTTWTISNMWTSYSGYNFSGAPEVHADKHTLNFKSDGTLFEGNDGGIYKSTNSGTSWTDLTDNMVISQMYRLGVSQTNSNITITGLQDNGSKLFNGSSWIDVTGGDGMECIVDFTNANTQYATYVNGEIYRTTNLWGSQVTISDNITGGANGWWVTPYIIDPNNHNTLYVGYADVWKTTNQGTSFTKISTMNSSGKIRSMAVAPSNSSYMYVADQTHLWKTTNGGTSWASITGTLPVSSNNITYIAVKNSDPLTVWVTFGGYDTNRIYKSINGGTSWTSISAGLPSLPVMSVVQNKLVTSEEQLYAGTDIGVFVKNGTASWQLFSTGLPNVVVTELEIYYNQTTPKNSKLRAATFGRGLWESDLYSVLINPPVAAFSGTPTSIYIGSTVTFTDESTNTPTAWNWTFSGGSPASSSQQNPAITYASVGTYDVTLQVTNAGGTSSETKTGYITVTLPPAPVVAFSGTPTSIYTGESITFADESTNTPTAWNWTFTGGTPAASTNQNPTVIYDSVGLFDVSLEVSNNGGSSSETKTGYITVSLTPAPVAAFSGNQTSVYIHDSVLFTDESTNTPTSWKWTLPGGLPDSSNIQNPTVHYDTVGVFDVTLEVSNNGGSSTETKTGYMTVTLPPAPVAAFSGNQTTVYIHDSVLFTDESTNTPTSWKWTFPGGLPDSSNIQNPTVHYDTVGVFDVALEVSNNGGSSTENKTGYMTVTLPPAPIAAFSAIPTEIYMGEPVTFSDESTNGPTSWIWTFTGGTPATSTDQNPIVSYDSMGTFDVTLEVSNYGGTSTETKISYITVSRPPIQIDFSGNPLTGAYPLIVNFNNTTVNAESYLWQFGDSLASTLKTLRIRIMRMEIIPLP